MYSINRTKGTSNFLAPTLRSVTDISNVHMQTNPFLELSHKRFEKNYISMSSFCSFSETNIL